MSDGALRPEDAPPSLYGVDGEPRFFHDPAMDRFVGVVLNLASELWLQVERTATLTELLRRGGLAGEAELEAIAAASEADPAREEALRTFVDRVLAPLREPSG